MQETCCKCAKKADITLNYGPHKYCKEHFTEFFEKRFKKTIRKHKLFKQGEKIAVGVSGGKDSMLSIFLLKKLFGKTNPIEALIIDEGIPGYRDKAIKTAVKACKEWKVPFRVIEFRKEFGITGTEIMEKISASNELGKSCCAFCGPFRRTILNKHAKQVQASKLVTGHNLDDEAQNILMNVFGNHTDKFLRLGATTGIPEHQNFIPRIKPLYESPEKEIIAYCMFNNIPHYSEKCCPFSSKAKRNKFRALLNEFELKYPGTKFSIIGFFNEIKKHLQEKTKKEIGTCSSCQQPSTTKKCNSCSNLERLLKQKKKTEIKKQAEQSCNELKELAT